MHLKPVEAKQTVRVEKDRKRREVASDVSASHCYRKTCPGWGLFGWIVHATMTAAWGMVMSVHSPMKDPAG